MIKYKLICDCESKFEGWFPSIEDFENQLSQGQLLCPMCDSTKVRRDVMAPSIKKKGPRLRGKEALLEMAQGQVVMGGKARQLLKKLEKHVTDNFENVGKDVPKEARKAVKGERNEEFYGTATKKEANELLNEGIDLFHVPKVRDN